MHQLFPLEIAAFIALLLIFRSAWKTRRKSSSVTVVLLYGLHSHLQQLPICLGQHNFIYRADHRVN